jgi:hypothetical protein
VKLIRRGLIPAAGIAVLAILLSACGGPMAASSAVIVGEQAVANTTLDNYVSDLHRALNEPVDEADFAVTQAALNRLILENLVDQSGARLGIVVTDAQIQGAIATADATLGGHDKLLAALLESQIPPTAINNAFRLSLTLEKMGPALVPGTDTQAQQQAVYDYVFNLAAEIGVTPNPRYGTWNAAELTLGALPTDLSTPVSK